jgi:hypothetical protein
VLVAFFISGGELIKYYFWGDTRDTGMDFFHSIEYLRGNHPYEYFGTLYPPLANLFFAILLKLIPSMQKEHMASSFNSSIAMRGTENDIRTFQSPMLLFIFFVVSCVMLVSVLTFIVLRDKEDRLRLWLVLSVMSSCGVVFALERGNIIILSWGLTLIFILTYDSKNRFQREVGLISLALAAGLKLYPALYGLLLLKKGRFGQAVRAIIYGILCIILPIFCFSEGLAGLKAWVGILRAYSVNGSLSADISAGGVLIELLVETFGFYGIELSSELLRIIQVLLFGIFVISAFLSKRRWMQLYNITMALFLVSVQNIYGMVFFLLPLLFFFRDEDVFEKTNIMNYLCLVTLTVNIPVFCYDSSGWPRREIYMLIYVVMIFKGIVELVKNIKEGARCSASGFSS